MIEIVSCRDFQGPKYKYEEAYVQKVRLQELIEAENWIGPYCPPLYLICLKKLLSRLLRELLYHLQRYFNWLLAQDTLDISSSNCFN